MKNIAISLGNRCDTAIWAVENKFRENRENGYKTCPFDLCVSNYEGVVDCIKDDFLHLTDLNFLTLEYYGYKDIEVLNAFPKQLLIYNTKYNFCFNHESPCHANLDEIQEWANGPTHFIDNDCTLFIERYNQRVQNFRNYLNDSNNHIVFMFKWDKCNGSDKCNGTDKCNDRSDDCIELRNVLNIKYPKLSYSIYIIE